MFRSLPQSFRPSRSGPAALILVYAEWCGFCQEFMPALKKMESNIAARVYGVNGDEDARTQQWKIEGYPTLLYRPRQGGLYKYEGDRSLQSINAFINSLER